MSHCPKCDRNLPPDSFASKGVGRKQPWCKECNRAYQRQHYLANTETYKAKAAAWRRQRLDELYQNIQAHIREHPCVDCGEADSVVLQFDHVRGKKRMGVAQMVRDHHSWATVAAEIAKCDVRCANCHARRTAKQLGWRKGLEIRLGAVDE